MQGALHSRRPNWITGYEFFGQDGWEPIDQDAFTVVHFKWPNPDPNQPWQSSPRFARSPAQTRPTRLTTMYSLLKNDAIAAYGLETPAGARDG